MPRTEVSGRPIHISDSMVVLHYIRNRTKRFKTFVANRLSIIQAGSLHDQWRYMDTKCNPADDVSRGLDAEQMVSKARWKRGAEFLWKDTAKWPIMPDSAPDLLENDQEVKQEVKTCAIDANVTDTSIDGLLEKYSSWYRLKRAVASLICFTQYAEME